MDDKIKEEPCFLYEVDKFNSIHEFHRFLKCIENADNEGYLKEVEVKDNYWGFEERWYLCNDSNEIWRLVYPDYPFQGFWRRYESKKQCRK